MVFPLDETRGGTERIATRGIESAHVDYALPQFDRLAALTRELVEALSKGGPWPVAQDFRAVAFDPRAGRATIHDDAVAAFRNYADLSDRLKALGGIVELSVERCENVTAASGELGCVDIELRWAATNRAHVPWFDWLIVASLLWRRTGANDWRLSRWHATVLDT